MINRRARDAADRLARTEAPDQPGHSLSGHTPPVGVHRDLKSGVSENPWGPLNGVDLCRESGNDQARLVENLITGPVWILLAQTVAQRHCAREQKGYVTKLIRSTSCLDGLFDPSCPRVQGQALIFKEQLAVRQRLLIRGICPSQTIRCYLAASVNG